MKNGAFHFLEKPFQDAQLLRLIEEAGPDHAKTFTAWVVVAGERNQPIDQRTSPFLIGLHDEAQTVPAGEC